VEQTSMPEVASAIGDDMTQFVRPNNVNNNNHGDDMLNVSAASAEPTIKCPQCDKYYRSQRDLDVHLLKRHNVDV
jgi:hypothetical protein